MGTFKLTRRVVHGLVLHIINILNLQCNNKSDNMLLTCHVAARVILAIACVVKLCKIIIKDCNNNIIIIMIEYQ